MATTTPMPIAPNRISSRTRRSQKLKISEAWARQACSQSGGTGVIATQEWQHVNLKGHLVGKVRVVVPVVVKAQCGFVVCVWLAKSTPSQDKVVFLCQTILLSFLWHLMWVGT